MQSWSEFLFICCCCCDCECDCTQANVQRCVHIVHKCSIFNYRLCDESKMIKMSCKSVPEFYFILNAEQNQRFTPKNGNSRSSNRQRRKILAKLWTCECARVFLSFAMNVNNEYIFHIIYGINTNIFCFQFDFFLWANTFWRHATTALTSLYQVIKSAGECIFFCHHCVLCAGLCGVCLRVLFWCARAHYYRPFFIPLAFVFKCECERSKLNLPVTLFLLLLLLLFCAC